VTIVTVRDVVMQEIDYDCTIAARTVTVTFNQEFLREESAVPVASLMTGCDGNATCKCFPTDRDFGGTASRGCPFHRWLKG
jgi:hypothetical protein